ncbi:hypothetical protein HanOQP8_Chr09g0308371 [Helianthus annuus]|nr:hypothetical protein HanOQP8_Chr09g0308371 [Helianthus annuus]
MLYEYGIMSTYLQSIKDQSMPAYDYTSSSGVLSFNVPCHHEEDRIKGLNLYCLYGLLGSNDNAISVWAKISNISKGVTWVYNPLVYCKPRVDEDVVWLSYWPIGNILDVGDEVTVDIFFEERTMIISGCGASLVYMDGEVDDENCENNTTMTKEEEVIGGDLSEFEVTTGCYYLCRRDLFGSETSYWLKWMFGDNVHYTDSRGWRKTHRSILLGVLRNQANTFLKVHYHIYFHYISLYSKVNCNLCLQTRCQHASPKLNFRPMNPCCLKLATL